MSILTKLQAIRNQQANERNQQTIERVFPRLQARYQAAINRRDVLLAMLQHDNDAQTRSDYDKACREIDACEDIAARLDEMDMTAIAEV